MTVARGPARDPRVMPEPGDIVYRPDVGSRRVESVSAIPPEARLEEVVDSASVGRWLTEHGWSRIGSSERESAWWSRPGVKRWICLSSGLAFNVKYLAAGEGRPTSDILRELGVDGSWVHWTRTGATKSPASRPQSGTCELRTWRRWARQAVVVRRPARSPSKRSRKRR